MQVVLISIIKLPYIKNITVSLYAAAHGVPDGRGRNAAIKRPCATRRTVIEEVTWESFRLSGLGAIPPAAIDQVGVETLVPPLAER